MPVPVVLSTGERNAPPLIHAFSVKNESIGARRPL